MQIAVIADIHGNLQALEAVLTDIRHYAPDLVVNLGDSLSGPLFPAECADLLMSCGFPTVRGNHERQLLTLTSAEMGESDRYTISCLKPHHIRWIEQTPESLVINGEVLLVHGTPKNDTAYLLETVDHQGARVATRMEVQERLSGITASLVFCGHTHIAREYSFERTLVLNPGSVGLQAYKDDLPFAHIMQMGSPHARYALVEQRNDVWCAEPRSVTYDWESAAETAEQRKRLDWAQALRSGCA